MTGSPALVSIGIPVYNEARFLASALESLLSQDYPAIEFILCDNASTDETLAIAERYAQEEPRLRIHRAASNLGAAANFQRAFDLATGSYFMWAAGHDRWSTNYVSACVAALEANPRGVLASGQSAWFDGDGTARVPPSALYSTVGLAPCARFLTVLHGNMHPVYGLIRLDALKAIGGVPRIVGADLVLLTRLSWRGEFLAVPECWWYRRRMHGEERYAQKMKRYRSHRYQLAGGGRLARLSPLAPLVVELLRQCVTQPQGLLKRGMLAIAMPFLMALRWMERE